MADSMNYCLDTLREIYGDTKRILDLSELNDFELTVVLVTRVLGVGVNMGLEGMLQDEIDGDPKYCNTIKSFERIGAFDVAALIREGLVLVVKDDDAKALKRLSKLSSHFFELEKLCFDRLAKFIHVWRS